MLVGTLKSAELKPDIDPRLFPPAQKPELQLGIHLGSNKRRQYSSDFIAASDLMILEPGLPHNHRNDHPQEQDEYDDGYFAAAGSL